MSTSRILRSEDRPRKTLPRYTLQVFEPVFLDQMKLRAFRLKPAFGKLILPFDEDRVAPEFIAPEDFYSNSF